VNHKIITLAAVVALALLAIAGSILSWNWFVLFLRIDDCLDSGGRWDYVNDRCVFYDENDESHAEDAALRRAGSMTL
jgi:hypothetical protein